MSSRDANRFIFLVSQAFSMPARKTRGLRISLKFSSCCFLLTSQTTTDPHGAFLGSLIWSSASNTLKPVTPLLNFDAFDNYSRELTIKTPSIQSLWLQLLIPKVSLMGSTAGSNVSPTGIVMPTECQGRLSSHLQTNAVTDIRTPPHRLLTWQGSRPKGTKGLLKVSGVRVRVRWN